MHGDCGNLMGDHNPIIVLMLKAPRPGTVKTRLARDLGAVPAAKIYRRLVERQVSQLPEGWPVVIHYSPADAEQEMRNWLGNGFRFIPQCDGDLGTRLIRAARHGFDHGAERLIFLGGDCPAITTGLLQECASDLNAHDVVIGPADDGGYYLIGVTQLEPHLFAEIDWSTERVLEQTLSRLREKNLSYCLLPVLEDVDNVKAWVRAARLLRQSSPTA